MEFLSILMLLMLASVVALIGFMVKELRLLKGIGEKLVQLSSSRDVFN